MPERFINDENKIEIPEPFIPFGYGNFLSF